MNQFWRFNKNERRRKKKKKTQKYPGKSCQHLKTFFLSLSLNLDISSSFFSFHSINVETKTFDTYFWFVGNHLSFGYANLIESEPRIISLFSYFFYAQFKTSFFFPSFCRLLAFERRICWTTLLSIRFSFLSSSQIQCEFASTSCCMEPDVSCTCEQKGKKKSQHL